MFWLGWCAGLEKLLAPAWLSNPYCLQLGRGAGFIARQSAASAAPPPHGANTAARTITHNTSVFLGPLVTTRPGFLEKISSLFVAPKNIFSWAIFSRRRLAATAPDDRGVGRDPL